MDKITEKDQKMLEWDNELRFYSHNYSDEQLIHTAQQAVDFAYKNFKEEEKLFQGFTFRYEAKIENIALGIDSYLQKHSKYKSSSLLKKFIINIINNDKYLGGRSGFVFLLYVLKMDEELRQIATEKKDFWEHPRLQFQLLYALYRRNIRGFEKEVQELMNKFPKGDIHKYSKKYLEKTKN